jgi:hypothetical protein
MTFLEMLSRLRANMMFFVGVVCTFLGLGVWLGAIAFFGMGVAAPVFKFLPSKDLAGMLNGIILQYLNLLEVIAWIVLMLGLLLTNLRIRTWFARVPIVLAGILLAITLWYAQGISPRMNTLKSAITSFDTPQPQDMQAIAEFRGLHIVYSRLVGANLGLLFVVLLWQSALLASGVIAPTSENK